MRITKQKTNQEETCLTESVKNQNERWHGYAERVPLPFAETGCAFL